MLCNHIDLYMSNQQQWFCGGCKQCAGRVATIVPLSIECLSYTIDLISDVLHLVDINYLQGNILHILQVLLEQVSILIIIINIQLALVRNIVLRGVDLSHNLNAPLVPPQLFHFQEDQYSFSIVLIVCVVHLSICCSRIAGHLLSYLFQNVFLIAITFVLIIVLPFQPCWQTFLCIVPL